MNESSESSGKSSGSAEQRKYCCVTGALPGPAAASGFLWVWGMRERGRGRLD
jgi:hypothetical protein